MDHRAALRDLTTRSNEDAGEAGGPGCGPPVSRITFEDLGKRPNEQVELPGEHTALHGFELARVPQCRGPFGPDGLG